MCSTVAGFSSLRNVGRNLAGHQRALLWKDTGRALSSWCSWSLASEDTAAARPGSSSPSCGNICWNIEPASSKNLVAENVEWNLERGGMKRCAHKTDWRRRESLFSSWVGRSQVESCSSHKRCIMNEEMLWSNIEMHAGGGGEIWAVL